MTEANTNTPQILSLGQALALTEQRDKNGDHKPFSMKWRTCNVKEKTGGRIKYQENLVRCGLAHNMKENGTIGVKIKDSKLHVTPVHIDLIFEVNGNKVTLWILKLLP